MGGILLLAGFECCGVAAAWKLAARRGAITRVWLGMALGLVMLMWFPALFAFFLDFTAAANWCALALVNGFGPAFMAGYGSASRIHHFMSTTVNTMGSAISTYTAQNIGAGRHDRVAEGIKASLTFMFSMTLILTVITYIFGGDLVGLFSDDTSAEAMQAGIFYLRLIVVALLPFSVFNCLNGVARGAGYMPAFTISTLTDLGVRVAFAYAFVSVFDRNVIAISVAVGWVIGMIVSLSFHLTGRWKNAKKV